MPEKNQLTEFLNDELFRRRVISRTSIGISLLILFGTLIRHSIAPLRTTTLIGISLSFALLLISHLIIKYQGKTKHAVTFLLTGILLISINAGIGNGGIMAPVTVGLVLLPIFGAITNGKNGAKLSTVLAIFGVLTLFILEQLNLVLPLLNFEKYTTYKSFIYLTTICVSYVIAYVYEKSRTEVQNELLRQKEALIQTSKMAALGEMSSGMAHEVNNPLAIIVGKTSRLKKLIERKSLSEEELITELQKIDEASNRIGKIVSGLRTFSHQSENESFNSVELEKIFSDILSLCHEKMKYNNIDLTINFESAKDTFIHARQSQVEQVLLNLINNSFDAIQNLTEKWIQISATIENNRVYIHVIDSGKGIADPIRQKMMQPFFTTKEVGKGTGLGLSISTGIIQQHQGKLYYDEKSPNTRFVIELPEIKYAS